MTIRKATLAARALRAIPSGARSEQSRENGRRGGRPLTLKVDLPTVEHFAGRDSSEGVLAAGTRLRRIERSETEDGPVWSFWAKGPGGWIEQRAYAEPQV